MFVEFGAGDGADGLGHLDAGLFAETTADAVVWVDVRLLVEAELHRFARQRAGAVTDATGAARKGIAEVGRDEGETHVDSESALFVRFEFFEGTGRADLSAGHTEGAALGSGGDFWCAQVFDSSFHAVEADAFVRADVGALTTGDAGVEEGLFGKRSGRAEEAAKFALGLRRKFIDEGEESRAHDAKGKRLEKAFSAY